MEKEYYSNCCDAPPLDYDVVDACDKATGYCQGCGDGAKFYLQNSDMNDPEFAEIIEQETEKVEKESKFKKQYHRGLKLYVKGDSVYYGVQGVMNLVEKHNKLVDILNKKGVIND